MDVPKPIQLETVEVEKPPVEFHAEGEPNEISLVSKPNTTGQSGLNEASLRLHRLPTGPDTSYSSKVPLDMDGDNDHFTGKLNRPHPKSRNFWKNLKFPSPRAFFQNLASCQCFSCCPFGRRATVKPQ